MNTRKPMQVTVACNRGVDVNRLTEALAHYKGVVRIEIGAGMATNGIPEGTVVIEVR